MKYYGIYDLFTKVYVSSIYGEEKKDKIFFDNPINDFNIKPNEAIFIDDNEVLLDIAVSKGFEVRLMDREERNFYKEQREQEEKILLQAVEQVQNVVKEEELNYDYKEANHRTYSVVSVDRPLTTIEKSQIIARVDSEFFHVEISDN